MTNLQDGPGSHEPQCAACCFIECFEEGFCSVGGSCFLGKGMPCCKWWAPFYDSVCRREATICWVVNKDEFWFDIKACLNELKCINLPLLATIYCNIMCHTSMDKKSDKTQFINKTNKNSPSNFEPFFLSGRKLQHKMAAGHV